MDVRHRDGLDPLELESHRAWLLRLARAILRDTDRAEDCVQDVFLTALRGPGKVSSTSLRAWLRRVLVNRARRAIDLESRRRHHEALAPSEHEGRSARERLEFLELQRELHRGVQALGERYRDVILMRHERELTPVEIAAELGVPTRTVNSWLYRAYCKLRERLDGRFERGAWIAWLALPRSVSGPKSAPTRAEPLALRTRRAAARPVGSWVLGLTVAGAGLCAFLAWPRGPELPAARSTRLEASPGPERAEPPLALLSPARAPTEPLVPAPPVESTPRPSWSGRVVDASGEPVAGLALRFEALTEADSLLFSDRTAAGFEELMQRMGRRFEPQRSDAADLSASVAGPGARTAEDGSFALEPPAVPGWIAVDDPRWSTLTTAVVLELPPPAAPEVHVARARAIHGRVHDADGLALNSVRVEFRVPGRFLGYESGTPTRIAYEPCTFTDEHGEFDFARLPDVADGILRFRANGFEPVELELGSCAAAHAALEVTLDAVDPDLVITGRVLDDRGAPIGGAFLSFEWCHTATSDEEGRFRLRLPESLSAAGPSRAGVLRAAARGFQPLTRRLSNASGTWPTVELAFAEPALEIRGVVLRADGTPHRHAAVWTPSPGVLGAPPGNRPPIFLEHVMSGPQDGGSLEATISRADGTFRLLGLQSRPYVLRVADLETREWFETAPLEAGSTEVLLEFPGDGCFPEVHGRVLARDGTPVPGARVARSYPRLDARMPDGRRFKTRFAGEPVCVDADGRFRLERVARKGGVLSVYGPTIESLQVELDEQPDPTELRLVPARLCRVVVESGELACDGFSFHDPERGALEFAPALQGISATVGRAPLETRSAEYLVSERADTLVLWAGQREVARVPLALEPATLNVLRP